MLNQTKRKICTIFALETRIYLRSECFNANLGLGKNNRGKSCLRATICIWASGPYGLFDRGVPLVSGQKLLSSALSFPVTSVGTNILPNSQQQTTNNTCALRKVYKRWSESQENLAGKMDSLPLSSTCRYATFTTLFFC